MLEPLKGNSQKSNHCGRTHTTAKKERGRVRNKSALSRTVNTEFFSALLTLKTRFDETPQRPDKEPPTEWTGSVLKTGLWRDFSASTQHPLTLNLTISLVPGLVVSIYVLWKLPAWTSCGRRTVGGVVTEVLRPDQDTRRLRLHLQQNRCHLSKWLTAARPLLAPGYIAGGEYHQ